MTEEDTECFRLAFKRIGKIGVVLRDEMESNRLSGNVKNVCGKQIRFSFTDYIDSNDNGNIQQGDRLHQPHQV